MTTNYNIKNFLFYRSFYEAISEFDDNDRLALYDSLCKFAFEGIETEFTGMKKAILSMATPLISASIKNYEKGIKGGRPKAPQQSTPKEETAQETISDAEVNAFIEDYKIHKNAKFEPTKKEREKIEIILADLGEYNQKYWIDVFQKAKAGYLINGAVVPCSLNKVLLEHNGIFRGEANLVPNKEVQEEKKEEQKRKDKAKADEYDKIAKSELVEREQARAEITNTEQALDYLNTYVKGSVLAKQVAFDYKDLKEIYPIGLSNDGVFYEKDT